MRSLGWALLLCAMLLGAAQAQEPVSWPPGAGADIVRVACTQCHAPKAFMQLRQGQEGWRRQVYDMILRGAQVQPGDIDAVVTYLSNHFGIANYAGAAGGADEVRLPGGDGKELTEQRCTLCHSLARAVGTRRTSGEWDAIVGRMLSVGAPISPSEARRISAYLKDEVAQ